METALLRSLKSSFQAGLAESADEVMKNARTFSRWFSSASGKASAVYATGLETVRIAAKQFFAGLYAPGGRLHNLEGEAVVPAI